jgi:hypothetical protein
MSEDSQVVELFEVGPGVDSEQALASWVMEKRDDWRDDYESNYEIQHDEYYRLWRAQWAAEDQQRKSERSKIIAPALQQAVESSVAEMEEATFGRGKWFDIADDLGDTEGKDVEAMKNKLMEDFSAQKIRKDVSECLINAAVFGTGIAEIVLEEVRELKPATREIMDGTMRAFGVEENDRMVVRLRPIMPKNFLIEPTATSVDSAVGVIIDEFVPRHQVEILQDSGVYKDVEVGTAAPDQDIEPDEDLVMYSEDRIRLTKYYGLVPKELLPDAKSDNRYVEAIVILANEGIVLKASANPYMMKDRPVVTFPWDIVPSRFWGRGVCEKGYMSQKALDTELRARIDALGLVVHPMLAMDATKVPRGFKPEVRPGKVILTNGNPAETLMPFKFGNLDTNTFQQATYLQELVQQATGAVDSTGLLSSISGETKAGAVSMSLGAVIKRHKRTLINFQESFLLPFIQKAAWRYMQFDPENYPFQDWKFTPSSTLGIIAREYEVSQLISLLQTMGQDSPLYASLVESVVENMNLSNREELLATLAQASQPNPEQQKKQQEQEMLQQATMKAQIAVLVSTARGEDARAEKYRAEAVATPVETQAKLIQASMGDLQDDAEGKDFDRRLALLDRMLKNKDLELKAVPKATPSAPVPGPVGPSTQGVPS